MDNDVSVDGSFTSKQNWYNTNSDWNTWRNKQMNRRDSREKKPEI